MTGIAYKILNKYRKRWLGREILRLFLYALAPSILIFFVFHSIVWTFVVFIFCLSLLIITYRPWKIDYLRVSRYLDLTIPELEHSSGLLLQTNEKLSDLAYLQQHRVLTKIESYPKLFKPPTSFKFAIILVSSFLLLGVILNQINIKGYFNTENSPIKTQEIILQPIDSTVSKSLIPKIKDQRLSINFPAYTRLPTTSTPDMHIKAIEGSIVTWSVSFDTPIKKVGISTTGTFLPMDFSNGVYTKSLKVLSSGFYSFEFYDIHDNKYLSDLYSIVRVKDEGPQISISGIDEFKSFEFYDDKIVNIEVSITDDFGIDDAYIIATLSSGEGEAIQFREEKLSFSESITKGNSKVSLNKRIDLDKLKMKPGDELYFFIEATDLKTPVHNISRSETFFVVIEDTLQSGYEVEGTLGADLMPDYFRSQRQLIIDTRKLIKERSKLGDKEFKFKSNELGFDQKALRLKYGQFMGDEADSGLAIASEETEEELELNEENDVEDPLAEYTHDHDSEDHQHELQPSTKDENDEEDPLHEYLHNHDDPEESTLFEESLKTKLREAMAQMWDSELYLRLYKPAQSLPYQYKALKLIQEIKNSARIYVHRIGFDPPPIKEEVRLTGELKDIGNYQKQQDFKRDELSGNIKRAIAILEDLILKNRTISTTDQVVFKDAGNELSNLALEQPVLYLKPLQNLKWLSEGVVKSDAILKETQKALFIAVKNIDHNPGKVDQYFSQLNQLIIKELNLND